MFRSESVSSQKSKASPKSSSRGELREPLSAKNFKNDEVDLSQHQADRCENVLRLMIGNLNAAVHKLSHNLLEFNRASVPEYKIPREFRMQLIMRAS